MPNTLEVLVVTRSKLISVNALLSPPPTFLILLILMTLLNDFADSADFSNFSHFVDFANIVDFVDCGTFLTVLPFTQIPNP